MSLSSKIGDADERAEAPTFTSAQLFYLERTMATKKPPVFTPATLDSAVALLGVIGERKGIETVLAHIQSLINTQGA